MSDEGGWVHRLGLYDGGDDQDDLCLNFWWGTSIIKEEIFCCFRFGLSGEGYGAEKQKKYKGIMPISQGDQHKGIVKRKAKNIKLFYDVTQ
ncbi:MAG: hypothetical protein Q8J76_05835 [Desulfobulbaceae bacterium]|nr:hypothetical protein [Desulfobulbaceae bacterium]